MYTIFNVKVMNEIVGMWIGLSDAFGSIIL